MIIEKLYLHRQGKQEIGAVRVTKPQLRTEAWVVFNTKSQTLNSPWVQLTQAVLPLGKSNVWGAPVKA